MSRLLLGAAACFAATWMLGCGSSSSGAASAGASGAAAGGASGAAGGGGGTSAGSAASGHGGATPANGGSASSGASGAANGGASSSGAANGGATSAGASGSGSAVVWRPFDDQSPWNTPIAADAASDPNSATMIQDFSNISDQSSFWINIQDFSVPVYFVDSSAVPLVTVNASLGGTGFRTGAAIGDAAGTGTAPIPAFAMPAVGSDKHLAIVDKATHQEWGFWDAENSAGNWTAGEASTLDLSGSGVRPPERSDPWWAGHGPRACGFGLSAGLITADEIKAGAIEHALVLAYPHIMSRYYVAPASSAQGTTTDALSTRGIPCGGQIQLDPSLDLATLGLDRAGLVIATALQKYGAFVGDYSGAVSLYADASTAAQSYWSTAGIDNGTAQNIPLAKFRVLTLGTKYDNMN